MPSLLLYSTNALLKLLIAERFNGDVHYVWCSETFDSGTLPRYTYRSAVPPTSNPADIYRDLKAAVEKQDAHSYKINEQKLSLKNLALNWRDSGKITKDEMEEMVYMVDHASFDQWRPLVYVIPRDLVAARLHPVPAAKRAGVGPEFIVQDLKRTEFELLELR